MSQVKAVRQKAFTFFCYSGPQLIAEDEPHEGEQAAFLSLPIQMLISTPSQTHPKEWLTRRLGTVWPNQIDV